MRLRYLRILRQRRSHVDALVQFLSVHAYLRTASRLEGKTTFDSIALWFVIVENAQLQHRFLRTLARLYHDSNEKTRWSDVHVFQLHSLLAIGLLQIVIAILHRLLERNRTLRVYIVALSVIQIQCINVDIILSVFVV